MGQELKDIRQTGAMTGNDLQQENAKPYDSAPPTPKVRRFSPNQLNNWYEGPEQSPIMQQHNGEYWGSSRHDLNSATEDEWAMMQQNPYEYRAQNQGILSKWGAGLVKGIALAGTTFLDGTLGLLWGVMDAATTREYNRLWDNELSTALQDFNQEMERWLPNYRTQEEQNNEWWQNLGTANFWADGVLKNLGFTVGAYYSGAAWTKGLQAIGWVKKAASAQVIGSLLSGLNEARIEANNGQREFIDAQNRAIEQARQTRAEEIAADSSLSDAEKIQELKDLDINVAIQQQDALERAHEMGLTTLIGNTVLLSIDNMWQFGKLYSRGFKNAKGLANRIEKGMAREGIEDVVEGGVRRYIPKTTSTGTKIALGLSHGLVEGNEEMAQAFISETAGHWMSPDSPDAYYNALLDPAARIQTKNFLTALADGFNNSYGNRSRWEEFAIGAFTGLLGVPTFGKVANSDANTWIGKGRTFGISGGVVGEVRSMRQAEAEATEAADVMNRYMDKLRTQAGYFAQSQSFTNAMDGYALEGDKFEYKNAQNNEDFAAISRFARTGRLEDLKEMINQDFENISDEMLEDIAKNTTPLYTPEDGLRDVDWNNTSGWRSRVDGTLMSESEEGRNQMRSLLEEKRDNILKAIDAYEESVSTVRAIGNNSLTEDQVNELAWLNWKVNVFNDRFDSVRKENSAWLGVLRESLSQFISNEKRYDDVMKDMEGNKDKKEGESEEQYRQRLEEVKEAKEKAMLDLNTKEGRTTLANLETVLKFLDAISEASTSESSSSLKMGAVIDSSPELQKYMSKDAWGTSLLEEISGLSHDRYQAVVESLADLGKIAKASREFNEKYKEFVENPIKQIQNRSRLEKKAAEKVEQVRDKIKQKSADSIARRFDFNANSATIARTLDENMEAINKVGGINEWIKTLPEEQQKKVRKAVAFQKGVKGIKDIIDNSDDERFSSERIKGIAKKLVDEAAEESETLEDLQDKVNRLLSETSVDEEVRRISKNLSDQEVQQNIAEVKEAIKDTFDDNFDQIKEAARQMEKLEELRKSEEVGKDKVPGEKQTPEPAAEEAPEEGMKVHSWEAVPQEEKMKEVHEVNFGKKKSKIKESSPVRKASNVSLPRPQLSELYLNGVDLESYLDYINQHPEGMPKLNGYTTQQYKKYIEATHQYLVNRGAFEYVKYHLSPSAELEFFFDEALNTEAGVPVVLMRTKKDKQVVGSMPSEIDFESIPNGQDKPLKVLAKAKYDLFKSIIDSYNQDKAENPDGIEEKVYHTTKVNKLMGGSPAWASMDSTMTEIFENTGHTPVLGIVGDNGEIKAIDNAVNKKINISILTGDFKQEGQLYLLIPSNNGSYVPALLYSTPIYQVVEKGGKDDWYIQQLIKKLQEAPTKINEEGNIYGQELFKWLRVNNLHVKAAYHEKGKWVKDTSKGLGKATHIVLNYDDDNGMLKTVTIPIKGKEISDEDAFKAIQLIAKTAKKATTNVVIGEMNGPNKADYVQNISRYLNTNVVRGQVHTINDFFTYQDGTEDSQKGNKKRITNPMKVKSSSVGLGLYIIHQNNSTITDSEGNIIEVGSDEYTRIMESYLATNPIAGETSKAPEVAETTPVTGEALDDLLGQLSGDGVIDQKPSKKASPGRKRRFLTTETAEGETTATATQLYKDVDKVQQMFPQLSKEGRVMLVNGLIRTTDEKGNPIEAYGEFADGVLYISDQSPDGTAYHEAFHYITNMLLDNSERNEMLEQAKLRYNTSNEMEAEEKLAEDFRHYMVSMTDSSFKGVLKRIFEKLKNIVNGIRGNRSGLDNLFYSIYRDGYKNRTESNGVNTDEVLFKENLKDYRYAKTDYAKLDADTKEYLKLRGISEEEYQSLTEDQRENLLHCM